MRPSVRRFGLAQFPLHTGQLGSEHSHLYCLTIAVDPHVC